MKRIVRSHSFRTAVVLFGFGTMAGAAWSQNPIGVTTTPITCPSTGRVIPAGTPGNQLDSLCPPASNSGSSTGGGMISLPASTNMRQAIQYGAVQGLVSGLFDALFSNNDDEKARQQQQQAFEEELTRQRAETARQHEIAEHKRIDGMYAELSSELKLNGFAPLALKTMDASAGLQLKGLDNLGTGGLKLKLGNDNPPPAADDCTGKSWGIPGLPGIYLNDCQQPSLFFPTTPCAFCSVQVAAASQSMSGSAREAVEQAVLDAAHKDTALISTTANPQISYFQQAEEQYQQAVQAKSVAQEQADAAQARVADDKSVMQLLAAKLQQPNASPAQQAALAQMNEAAKTDEGAAVQAQTQFESASIHVSVTRTNAVNALAAIPNPNAPPAVDLSGAKQPLVPYVPGTPSHDTTEAPRSSPAALSPVAPSGDAWLSAPGHPLFDCAGDRAAIVRLKAGLPVQEEAIRRTEAALAAADKDLAKASAEALLGAVQTMGSGATAILDWDEAIVARHEGLKAMGLYEKPNAEDASRTLSDPAARFKFLQQMEQIADRANKIASDLDVLMHLPEAYEALHTYGERTTAELAARDLRAQKDSLWHLVYDSGLYDEALEKSGNVFLRFGFGPIVGPAFAEGFDTLIAGFDTYVAWNELKGSAGDARLARQNLEKMREQLLRVRAHIGDFNEEIRQECSSENATTRKID
jgi:hypothetical protein